MLAIKKKTAGQPQHTSEHEPQPPEREPGPNPVQQRAPDTRLHVHGREVVERNRPDRVGDCGRGGPRIFVCGGDGRGSGRVGAFLCVVGHLVVGQLENLWGGDFFFLVGRRLGSGVGGLRNAHMVSLGGGQGRADILTMADWQRRCT